MKRDDSERISKFKLDNRDSFRILFEKYYRILTLYAVSFVRNTNNAEEIVQEFFVNLWERRTTLTIEKSERIYLFRSIRNRCLNYLQSGERKTVFTDDFSSLESEDNIDERIDYLETEERIFNAINNLPPKCRQIFTMSRMDNLTYREIARNLGIAEKTVENQIGIALKKISGVL